MEAAVARLVSCVERGSLPGLRRVGEVGTARMARRDLVDVLAAQGRAPLRSGGHAVERVLEASLDVRRAGPRSYQVLLRWKGAHDDEWRPMAACNDLTKREAQVLIKRKFPPRSSGCGEARVARRPPEREGR